ncbi:MAG: DUF1499 domain-containing protein [Betaproteobacteria bacterium]|nr:DUF1499 domain-containing protein [Betaproteobacteria bacterium]
MKRAAVLLVWAGAAIALACVVGAVGAALGNRVGVWDYRVALTLLLGSVYVAAGAGVAAFAGLVLAAIRRAGLEAAVGAAGLAIALALVVPVWNLQRAASQLPSIHDITTDTENPPPFVGLLALRQKVPNGAAYGGPKLAAQQRAGYPDIGPALLKAAPAQAFDRALAVAKDMGWEIAATDPAQGRIEATATTFWFGFKDDIVIRIAPTASGSRIDIRSMSRVGHSDIGANAKRIRAFLTAVQAQP